MAQKPASTGKRSGVKPRQRSRRPTVGTVEKDVGQNGYLGLDERIRHADLQATVLYQGLTNFDKAFHKIDNVEALEGELKVLLARAAYTAGLLAGIVSILEKAQDD